MNEWIAALISAVGAISQTVASGISSSNMNKKNRAWQEDMYERQLKDQQDVREYQNDYNRQLMIDEFNMNAEYNSPVAQMERLHEAGLNPNLAYSNLGGETTAAFQPSADGSIPSLPGSGPYQNGMDFSPIMSSINMILDYKAKKEQLDMQKNMNTEQVEKLKLENDMLRREIPYRFGGIFYEYDSEKHEYKKDENGNYIPHHYLGTMDYQLKQMEHETFIKFFDKLNADTNWEIKNIEKQIMENNRDMSDKEKQLLQNKLEQAEYIKSKLDNVFNSDKDTMDKFLDIMELFIFNTLSSPNFNAYNVK